MQIKVFCELYWAVTRPTLTFYLNGERLSEEVLLLDRLLNEEHVVYTMQAKDSQDNCLEIVLSEKTDDKVTEDCDHWVSVKDISIDGVHSDWLLYDNTVFKHSMDKSWIDFMKTEGYDIQPEYRPGTDLRLNGTCSYYFKTPFWLFRVMEHDNK